MIMQTKSEKVAKFVREVYSQSAGVIHLHEPLFRGNEKEYLLECIDSTFVSSVGKFVDQFETQLAKYTGVKKVVVCVNGTSALHLALRLCGVRHDDEVITQALTFVATANAISYCGADPVFLDVDRDTLGLSPNALRAFLEAETVQRGDECLNRRTKRKIKACVPMHTFGHPCRIDQIVDICRQHNVEVIEDAAESIGSFYKATHTGTFGKVGVLSFNGNKTITCGGGGALLFNDEKLAARAKHLSTQAKVPHVYEFSHNDIGYNYRMPNVNAAIGLAQLEQLGVYITAKRELAKKYERFFRDVDVEFVREPTDSMSNYWLNAILLRDLPERDAFLVSLQESGIMARAVWKLINKLPMYEDCQADTLANSIWLEDRIVNIPSSVRI